MSAAGQLLEPLRRLRRNGFTRRAGVTTILAGGTVAFLGFSLATGDIVSVLVGTVAMLAGISVIVAVLVVGSVDDRALARRAARDRSQAELPAGELAKLEKCRTPGSLCDCPRWHPRW